VGGGKRKTKTEQRIQYPAGFESFFKRAGDIILKHAQIPRSSIFEMKLSPFERDIYGRISSLLSAGTTPADTLIQNYFLNRMGISSPLLRTMPTEPSFHVLPPLSEGRLPEYKEPIPPALDLSQTQTELRRSEYEKPSISWQQLFDIATPFLESFFKTLTPSPHISLDVLKSPSDVLQAGATALRLKQEFPELSTEKAQGIISDLLSRSYSYDYGYGLPNSVGSFLYGKDEPTRRAFRMLESAGLWNIRDAYPEV